MSDTLSSAFADTKPHYNILDGLRGVAALTVVCFHLQVPVVALIIATLMNVLLIPATPGMEIRGVGEMYPLNGPSWSLFFEYIGNILYAFFLHKLSTKVLSILVLSAGCGLAIFALWGPLGDICVGFALTEENIIGGSLRLLFSFPAGLLFPLYMVHYPFIYLYYAWVKNENLTFIQSLPGAVALVAGSVVLAYLCLKLYDEPVRRFLSRRLRIN